MIYKLRFLPEVEFDVISGYSWYELKSSGLGEDFIRLFYASVNGLSNNPLLYAKIKGNYRRRMMKRFPYSIYYIVENDFVIICGLFHSARNPKVLHMNLRKRIKG